MKLITRRRVISLCVSAMLAFSLVGCASRSNDFHDMRESGGSEVKNPDAGLMAEDEPESGTVLDGSEYGYARTAQVSLNDDLDCLSRLDSIYMGPSWAGMKAKNVRNLEQNDVYITYIISYCKIPYRKIQKDPGQLTG